MRRIALTTTVPVETVFAAGAAPLDLNNLFVGAGANGAATRVNDAENFGFPANLCAWVKGLFGAARAEKITELISVVAGDCSPNAALGDLLAEDGVKVFPFAYPRENDAAAFDRAIADLETQLGVTRAETATQKKRLDAIRIFAKNIDDAAWQKHCVHSGELFNSQLILTDFLGDPAHCAEILAERAARAKTAPARDDKIPLAVIGVPTILSDLWDVIENAGGRVVYHEIPHQFSFADHLGADVIETYRHFTYPAPAPRRVAEIAAQVKKRGARGIIHYTQAFCHRQLHALFLRRVLDLPILTLDADRPAATDGRTITRLEAFLEQLQNG